MAGSDRESAFDLSSRRTTEHPASSPGSGQANANLFRGGSGPGYWIQSGVELVFEELDLAPFEVVRLSPEALWFVPCAAAPVSTKTLRVSLRSRGRTVAALRGRLVHLGQRTERPCVGLRLIDVSIDAGRDILEMIDGLVREGVAEPAFKLSPIQEEITNTDRIRAIMGALTGVPSEGLPQSSGKLARFQIESMDLERESLVWTPCGEIDEALPEGELVLEVHGYNSIYRIHLPSVARVEGQLVTPLPTKLQRLRYRFFRRGMVRSAHLVEFRHPVWRDLHIEAEVRDVSFGGLSFSTNRKEDLLFPGLVVPYLEVKTDEGKTIGLRGQIRSVASVEGEDLDVCGMSVTAYWPEGEGDWMRLASETLYPTTRTSEHLTEELWSLFVDSGYFKLAGKTTEEFEELKTGFIDVGQRAARVPRLVCQAVWPSSRGVEASVSFLKAYQHSWMGHQLAKRPGKPPVEVPGAGQIMRDIYLRAFEHPQADPDFDWMIGYVEATVPWMNKAHIEFARKYASTGHALVLPTRMMSAVCAEPSGLPHDGLQIGPATGEELALLSEQVRTIRTRAYFEALDFTEDRIGFEDMAQQWHNAAFDRRRAVLFARRDGVPVAAAVLETGELGTNMFRLLDSVRVFPFVDDARAEYVALLDEARRWYKSVGRSSFLFLREDEDWSYAEPARLHDISEPCFWIISSSILPDFLEHVCELTGRRRFGG
jgi:hypothetical protein